MAFVFRQVELYFLEDMYSWCPLLQQSTQLNWSVRERVRLFERKSLDNRSQEPDVIERRTDFKCIRQDRSGTQFQNGPLRIRQCPCCQVMSRIHLQIKTHLFSESHRPTQARCQVKNIHFGNNRLLLKVGGTLSHCGNNSSQNSVVYHPTVVVHTDRR